MAPVVLLSFAVYGATASATLYLARRFVLPVRGGVALLLACAPLLFTGKAMLTGGVYAPIDIIYDANPFGAHREALHVPTDRTPALGDVVYQEIPWRAAARRALFEGRLPLWNPNILAGDPLLAVQQAAILHPGTWIGLLLPLPQAWTFDMAFRLLLALLCAFLFLRDLGCGEAASLLGACGWAFSDYLIFFLGYPLAPAAGPFPLMLLGARRVVREPGRRGVGLLVVAFLLALTAGHPETVLHAGCAAGLYFLYELASAPRGRRLRPLLLALLAAGISLGLCAVLLVPLMEALPQTREHLLRTTWYAHIPRSLAWRENLRRLVPQLVPYAVGVSGRGSQLEGFIEPSANAGSLLVPFALAGLFSRNRARWFFLGLGLFCLAVCVKTAAADLLAKLPLFDIALNERLVFLVSFSLCALAALGAERLPERSGARTVLVAGVMTAGLVVWTFLHFRPRMTSLNMPAPYMNARFLLQIVPLLALCGIALLPVRHRAGAGLAGLVAVFALARTLEASSVNPTMPAETFYPPLSILDRIPRGVPFRTAGLGRAFIPNAAAVYDIEDVRGYEAMTLRTLSETYPLWSTPQGVWFNRVDDPTAPFLSFLNVRWVLAPLERPVPAGWRVLSEDEGLRLLENPSVLPRVFLPRFIRAEPGPDLAMAELKAIADFREQDLVESGAAPPDWTANGEGQVTITAYGPQSLEADVTARRETLVATSIPRWTGWNATLDGHPVEMLTCNHAFLAFRVPGGAHRLSLRYFSAGTRVGLAVSALTLALCVALLVRRPAPAPSPAGG